MTDNFRFYIVEIRLANNVIVINTKTLHFVQFVP